MTFRFEYEVFEPVPSLGLAFILYRPTEGGTRLSGEQVVTEICEVVSAEALEAGKMGAVGLTLPRLSLMANRLMVYAWFGSATDRRSGYDAIDANVDLPPLTIVTETKGRKCSGLCSSNTN